ncbi:thiamine-monophosphate kinase [Arenimonas soli]|uniref:Thiamine-monophosphate kinase n=1 Tax=Arenimonas soli TaxID=2269504 RepID=A0ABQ1HQA8_9GAMM|nr:thiamine-phosphate kinase [Arenimonas soli]GGA84810.1 thiamine-monophosphate kinase [Arenimonas soli]
MPGEFALIDRIRARAARRDDVVRGIGDDAAVLAVPDGHELVVTCDTLVAGVHFPDGTAPSDVGYKALAVNLSDLAAMAAAPAWCTLALTLPDGDEAWLDAFLDGFLELADEHGVSLVGGDTTRGPLAMTVTAHGLVPAGQALLRSGARVGEDIWVTGTLGDAAGGLAQWRQRGPASAKLRYRLDRPTPRVQAGLALRGLASAAVDLSDGLAADLGHVLAASGVGARLDLGRLPCSRTLADHFDENRRWELQLTGGDDYELCFTAPAARALEIEQALAALELPATVVGQVEAEPGLRLLTPEGGAWTPPATGYQHFEGGHA